MKKRFISVYLPHWSIEIARKIHGNAPHELVLVEERNQKRYVARCCQSASSRGISIGMPLELAETLADKLTIQPFQPKEELRFLKRLALWALTFSPLVGLSPELLSSYEKEICPGPLAPGLIIDISGTERLHRGEDKLATRILEKFTQAHLTAQIGIGPTVGSAWATARFGSSPYSIIPQSASLKEALSLYPLAALRLEEETCTTLSELGIYTIGEVLKFPRKEIGQRWGKEVLYSLMTTFGEKEEKICFVSPQKEWIETQQFDSPLTSKSAVTLATTRLFEKLTSSLYHSALQARRFTISLVGSSSTGTPFTTSRELFLISGTSNYHHLSLLIEPLLNTLPLEGGITKVQIHALQVEHHNHEQEDFSGQVTKSSNYNSLINQLIQRLEPQRVCKLILQDSHLPERSFCFIPVTGSQGSLPSLPCSERPSVLLDPPEEANVVALLPDNPPSLLFWRNSRSKVLCGIGPEQISPEWWSQNPDESYEVRHYYRLQTERGLWIWVFRTKMNWFVHGIWG